MTRPILPCADVALTALDAWVDHGLVPPRDGTVARSASGDLANTGTLPPR